MQPGPSRFERSGDLDWELLASLGPGHPGDDQHPFARLGAPSYSASPSTTCMPVSPYSPYAFLYAVSSAVLYLRLFIAVGLVGFFMHRYNMALARVLITLILCQRAETELRHPLPVSEGSLGVLVTVPSR
jgi:putative tricarboxylic transport membrane protein